ncbi:hypothetical protein [uncultured Azohydromonas sp.]|jgi:hypothetical protein|uniref:hypothetical protein n=1 Tax=uncultured Azohydromonas sp. TaxID=487342 RepID=UPI0026047B6A|nr:hypothetical protein [uncultured Azohydromonas sp.]
MTSCLNRLRGAVPSLLLPAVLLGPCGLTAAGAAGAAAPAPAAASSPDNGPAVLSLELHGGVDGKLLPFTVGQPLRQGQLREGALLAAADVPDLQCVVQNRWPDGSAKFVLLSGRVDMKAGLGRKLLLGVGDTPAPGPVVKPDSLARAGLSANVSFGSYGVAGWTGKDWDTPARTLVAGPQMSAWTYRKPIGTDAHLVAWLEVRSYQGGHVEVLPWIENGHLNVPGSGERSGTATFTLGGTQRFSQPLTLLNHQRAVLAEGTQLTHWAGADPRIVPRHDVAYFMATRLVPRYSAVTPPRSPLYGRLPTSYTPLAQAAYPQAMGTVGYHASIGLLPEWDVAYLSTGADVRAWRSVLINAYAAGRYGIHYRDEKTQRPLAFSRHPKLTMGGGSGVTGLSSSSAGQVTPAAVGGVPPPFTTSHHPSMGYMAYLVSGWNYFLEESQFVATANYLKNNDVQRFGSKGILQSSSGALTTRGAAWALRSLAQAAAVTPDSDPWRAELVASLNANIGYYHDRYVTRPSSPLGIVEPYAPYFPTDPWMGAIWMEDFFTAAWAYVSELKVHDTALQPRLDAFLAWKARSIVGRLGGSGSGEYAFPHAAQYRIPFAPRVKTDWANGTGPWYASWGEVARAMGLPTAGEPGDAMVSGYPGSATAYWGALMPALAYAVDLRAEGAAKAWQRVTSSPTYPKLARDFDNHPVWSVYPRSVP